LQSPAQVATARQAYSKCSDCLTHGLVKSQGQVALCPAQILFHVLPGLYKITMSACNSATSVHGRCWIRTARALTMTT
jgi:hypothetical protein